MTKEDNGTRDTSFLWILTVFGVILVMFGLVAVIVTVWGDPSEKVIFRLIGAMGSMFSGMLGLTIGYLTGRR